MTTDFSEKEKEVLVLEIVDACIQYSKEHGETFQQVLEKSVFVGEAREGISEMVCKTMESLHTKGYIEGTVELSYQSDIDQETWEESPTDTIDFEWIKLEDISISTKGKVLLGSETLKALGKRFIQNMALENEGKRPGFDNLLKLMHTLNIPADAIIYPKQKSEDNENEQLFRMFQMLDDRDKKIIRATMQEMLSNK